MNDFGAEGIRPHARPRHAKRVVRTVFAFILYIRDVFVEDVLRISRNGRLFFGVLCVVVGLLSFASDKYCDGNPSTYYTCTRPETYYYYPWWAIALCILGSFSIILWFLRKKTR